MKSLYDPSYPGSLLPLWVARFWCQMWDIRAIQVAWKKGVEWLDGKITSIKENKMYIEARELTRILRWDEKTEIPGANGDTTCSFASYLSDDSMMATKHIDMMFAHLSDRVEMDGTLDSLVAVETLRFWRAVEKATSAKYFNAKSERFLLRMRV
ncbi:hypothetical protein CPC08DRAFT_174478 [Agrocybe pediades]|nr:hypothetical protein CPC08DRAFT_174478 [Agrocybe pediades]